MNVMIVIYDKVGDEDDINDSFSKTLSEIAFDLVAIQFWYMRIIKACYFQDELEDSDSELIIISVLPKTIPSNTDVTQLQYRLTPHTNVTFLACRYRLVLVLDVSPSSASVVCTFF